jgi:hypothetical protein
VLDLRTGRVTSFGWSGDAVASGFTRPGAGGIVAVGAVPHSELNSRIIRYTSRGRDRKVLWTGFYGGSIVARGGKTLAVGGDSGLELVDSGGRGVIRRLPVPHVGAGCAPIRWWTVTKVLATCAASELPGSDAQRLWLVPTGGARPTALTPQRPDHGGDQGDFSAWRLNSGLYLEAMAARCGSHVVARQDSHGAATDIRVPGAVDITIDTATASRLLVQRRASCETVSTSLAWFNPATRKLTVAVAARHGVWGVSAVVPYYVQGKRQQPRWGRAPAA